MQQKFLLLKTTKNARICAIHREKTRFGAFPEAKKGVARAQVRYKYSPEAQENKNPSRL